MNYNFQQHTEVNWLSIGPAIKRILEQWEAICHFISELAKEPKEMPKSINFKRGVLNAWYKGKSSYITYWSSSTV